MSKNKQETQNKQKRLELTNDYVFKRIFAKPKNNQELKEFVEAILDIKIKKIEVKNPEITKNYCYRSIKSRIEKPQAYRI